MQFAVFLLAFIVWEYRMDTKAILPFNILLRRNILGAFIEAVRFCAL
jgi:hypothetical protein